MEFLHEVCGEEVAERNRLKIIRIILVNFPSKMLEIATCYDENVNDDSMGLVHILTKGEIWIELEKFTMKQLQSTQKIVLDKHLTRTLIQSWEQKDIIKFRNQCKKHMSSFQMVTKLDCFINKRNILFVFKSV